MKRCRQRRVWLAGLTAAVALGRSGAAAQSEVPSLALAAGLSWLELNGTRRLVRGDRKVVTTDASGGVAPWLEVTYPLTRNLRLDVGVTRLASEYTHTETFTNGMVLQTVDDLVLQMYTGGVGRSWRLGSWSVAGEAHLALLRYSPYLELASERQVPSDLSTINRGPFDLKVSNGVGLGVRLEVDAPLSRAVVVRSSVGLTVGFMPADILDDPEDPEPGHDVFSPMHPLSVGLGLGYRPRR